jgi:hypothetical protein
MSPERRPGDLRPDSEVDFVISITSICDCWLSDVQGDPGRTLDERHALRFRNINDARKVLNDTKRAYPERTYLVDTLPVLRNKLHPKNFGQDFNAKPELTGAAISLQLSKESIR